MGHLLTSAIVSTVAQGASDTFGSDGEAQDDLLAWFHEARS
jgi:hypothetical protein